MHDFLPLYQDKRFTLSKYVGFNGEALWECLTCSDMHSDTTIRRHWAATHGAALKMRVKAGEISKVRASQILRKKMGVRECVKCQRPRVLSQLCEYHRVQYNTSKMRRYYQKKGLPLPKYLTLKGR